mmetsp:Transcript_10109/g.18577  ORF Transcript_10109/g.18577 Transcript_10109/m.18577 type:complete len:1276 (-) Transcript_10109:194-4021(-)
MFSGFKANDDEDRYAAVVPFRQSVSAMDISADQGVIALGGNNCLKLCRLDYLLGGVDKNAHDVKTSGHDTALQSILRVKFYPKLDFAHLLATTSSSGIIAIWDILNPRENGNFPVVKLKEHSQAVSGVSWHPSDSSVIITGSNDGNVKLWDLRVRSGSTLSIQLRSSEVRDVQFPKVENGQRFAAACGNGTIQVWDVRHAKGAETSIKAHDCAYSVDWHPEINNMLASGGRDSVIKIWDISQNGPKRDSNNDAAMSENGVLGAGLSLPTTGGGKPSHSPRILGSKKHKRKKTNQSAETIQTTGKGVSQVCWRPGHPYQIASVPVHGNTIQIWDIKEPKVPLACLEVCDSAETPTGIVWVDQLLHKDDAMGSSLYKTRFWNEEEGEDFVFDVFSEKPSQTKSIEGDSSTQKTTSLIGSLLLSSQTSQTPLSASGAQDKAKPYEASVLKHIKQSDVQSQVGSIMSRDTNVVKVDHGIVTDRKETQRRRFRHYKHEHPSKEMKEESWSVLVGCSQTGTLQVTSLKEATQPLKLHPTCVFSFSCESKIAAIYDPVPLLRIDDGLRLHYQLSPDERPPKPSNMMHIFSAKEVRSPWNKSEYETSEETIAAQKSHSIFATAAKVPMLTVENATASGRPIMGSWEGTNLSQSKTKAQKLTSSTLGFDATQFKLLAMAYIMPKRSFERINVGPSDESGEVRSVHHSEEELALCCKVNAEAADAACSPRIAQLWRMVQLLYVPNTADTVIGGIPFTSPSTEVERTNSPPPDSFAFGPYVGLQNSSENYRLPAQGPYQGQARDDMGVRYHSSGHGALSPKSALSKSPVGASPSSIPSIPKLPSLFLEEESNDTVAPAPGRPASQSFHSWSSHVSGISSQVPGPPPEEGLFAAAVNTDADSIQSDTTSSDVYEGDYDRNKSTIISFSDKLPTKNGTNGLWLGDSLNLLCRLNFMNPLEETHFKMASTRLEQDRRELVNALESAKPKQAEVPVPKGERRLRRQRRQQRRQEFSYRYSEQYRDQMHSFPTAIPPVHGPQQVPSKFETEIKEKRGGQESSSNGSHALECPFPPGDGSEQRKSQSIFPSQEHSDEHPNEQQSEPQDSISPFSYIYGNQEDMRSEVINHLLEQFADQGDVQTCAMLVLVLGNRLKLDEDFRRQKIWITSYIDLLQQLQVFSVAARIISVYKPHDTERYFTSTSQIPEGCSNCQKTDPKNFIVKTDNTTFKGVCSGCHLPVSRCSICEQLVRGTYVWCQGCGHGGHLDHLSEWFATEKTCPTGCGHICTFSH